MERVGVNRVFVYALASVLLAILLTYLFNSQGCGQSLFTETEDNDSLKVALAFSEGETSGMLREKVKTDSLTKIIHDLNAAKAEKSDRAIAAYIPKFQKKDSVLKTASVEDQNAFLKDLLDKCDAAARSLIDERNGLRTELEMVYADRDIGDAIIKKQGKEKEILKTIVKNLEDEVKQLSKTSFWQEHKFEIGFIAGAAATTASYLLAK